MLTAGSIKQAARDIGFDRVGISPPTLSPSPEEFLKEWLDAGYAADMQWMVRDGVKRAHPEWIVEDAKSVICVALNYFTGAAEADAASGVIAQYARGRDYHKVIQKMLKKLAQWITDNADGAHIKMYVDTGPILEKAFAAQAGLGFMGKNTTMITREFGSYVFLGVLITNLELEFDRPVSLNCGTCTRCLEACPTNALPSPYTLDSNLCISYHTIESREAIPENLRPQFGNLIFGCDICQDVCPFNKKAKPTSNPDFGGRPGAIRLDEILSIRTPEEFEKKFAGTPVMRAKREGLLRNAAVAAGNLVRTGDRGMIAVLEETTTSDTSPLVREHTRWALDQTER